MLMTVIPISFLSMALSSLLSSADAQQQFVNWLPIAWKLNIQIKKLNYYILTENYNKDT